MTWYTFGCYGRSSFTEIMQLVLTCNT